MRGYNIRFIPGLDCFFNSLYIYLESIGRANPLIYSEIWNFVYEENPEENPEQLIGMKVADDMDYEKYSQLLVKYCGIELSNVIEYDVDKTLNFMKQQMERDCPVGFFWDTFWCPWHEDYKKAHHPHACLAVKMDAESITCLDPIVISRLGVLKMDDFRDGYIGLYLGINVLDTYEESDYKKVFKDAVHYLENNKKFENMEKFILDFTDNFDIKKEFSAVKSSLYDVSFYNYIRQMAGYGFLYGDFIAEIGRKIQIESLKNCAKELKILYDDWSAVLGEFVVYYNKEYTQEIHQNMIGKLKKLYQREKNIYCELRNINLTNNMNNFSPKYELLPSKFKKMHRNISSHLQ